MLVIAFAELIANNVCLFIVYMDVYSERLRCLMAFNVMLCQSTGHSRVQPQTANNYGANSPGECTLVTPWVWVSYTKCIK